MKSTYSNVLFCVFVIACSSAAPQDQQTKPAPSVALSVPETPGNSPLRDELLAMSKEDQRIRREWINNPDDPEIKAQSEKIDKPNQARVIQIIDQYGWPG